MDVFIADDSTHIIRSLTDLLSDLVNVRITGTAGTVPDTVKGIAGLEPDVVILDLRMPGGSGIDIIDTLRPPKPIVIVFSAYVQSAYKKICLEKGADYVFSKTEDIRPLLSLLQKLAGTTDM